MEYDCVKCGRKRIRGILYCEHGQFHKAFEAGRQNGREEAIKIIKTYEKKWDNQYVMWDDIEKLIAALHTSAAQPPNAPALRAREPEGKGGKKCYP